MTIKYSLKKNMINAALFDFDGTLVNTDTVHLACWNKCLSVYGTSLDDSFYSRHCSGYLTIDIAEKIIRTKPQVSTSIKALAQEKESHYEEWIASKKIPSMPGVREVLIFLRDRKIRIGIVTGAPLSAIVKPLHDNELFDFFQIMVTREDVNRGKPAPDGYILGLKKLGTEGRFAVSFEDTQLGVLAAKSAKMHSFAIPNIYTALHAFSSADNLCTDMLNAKDILSRILI